MVPSFVIILCRLDPTQSLVISQVVLSFSLPLTLIPLVMFTGRKEIMGTLVNRNATKALVVLIVTVIIALNGYLLYGVFTGS
jgi:manganese transport protein